MSNTLLKLYVSVQTLLAGEEGQDLIEYALLVTLIALAAISGMGTVASAITASFTNISTSIA